MFVDVIMFVVDVGEGCGGGNKVEVWLVDGSPIVIVFSWVGRERLFLLGVWSNLALSAYSCWGVSRGIADGSDTGSWGGKVVEVVGVGLVGASIVGFWWEEVGGSGRVFVEKECGRVECVLLRFRRLVCLCCLGGVFVVVCRGGIGRKGELEECEGGRKFGGMCE